MSTRIFFDFIVEEYRKNHKKNVDIVGTKRATFNDLLSKANGSLKHSEYVTAKELYSQILKQLDEDPYPDEYNLEENALFCIKCCYGYSLINSCKDTAQSNKSTVNSTEKFLISLMQSYPSTIMPYYLKLLFISRKPK